MDKWRVLVNFLEIFLTMDDNLNLVYFEPRIATHSRLHGFPFQIYTFVILYFRHLNLKFNLTETSFHKFYLFFSCSKEFMGWQASKIE